MDSTFVQEKVFGGNGDPSNRKLLFQYSRRLGKIELTYKSEPILSIEMNPSEVKKGTLPRRQQTIQQ